MTRPVREGSRDFAPSEREAEGTVVIVLTCDYNGWNDAPEEEREWFDEHPEVWNASIRDPDGRPHRATSRPAVRRFRGGLAA
jgi:hypothetical protein